MQRTTGVDPISQAPLIDKGDQWKGVEAGNYAGDDGGEGGDTALLQDDGELQEGDQGDDQSRFAVVRRRNAAEKAADLIHRLSLGRNFDSSWKYAGFRSAVEARRAMDSPGLRAQAMHMRDSWLKTEGAAKAIHRLNKLMDDGVSPSVQLGAAKLVLELAGHAKGGDAAEKPMAEMTEAELQDLIDRMERQMAGGKSPVIKVKP